MINYLHVDDQIDEQVYAALQLLKGEGVPLVATSSGGLSSSGGIIDSATTTQKKKMDGSGENAKLTYETLLQAQITTADATN